MSEASPDRQSVGSRRRRSCRGPLLAFFGVVLVLLPFAFVVVDPPRRHWRRMLTRVEKIEEAWLSASTAREPLNPPASTGVAWDHYWKAHSSIRARPDRAADLSSAATGAALASDDQARAARDLLLARLAIELEHVRRGARASERGRMADWSRGLAGPVPSLLRSRTLAFLGVAQGIAEIEAGRPVVGVESWLDGMQFARDTLGGATLISEAVGCEILVPGPLLEFFARGGAAQLSAPALDRFEQGLARLDESLSMQIPAFELELALFARHFDYVPAGDGDMGSSVRSLAGVGNLRWQVLLLLSWRIVLADAIDRSLDLVEDLESVDLANLERALATTEAGARSHDNPLVENVGPSRVTGIAHGRRAAIVRVRSLRTALALYGGQPAPTTPLDPFGAATSLHDDGETIEVTTTIGKQVIEVRLARRTAR